ncbi:hypothetical protein SAMN04489727_1897 [Amycolatopsis tolypomycina]|uniref:Uncharacterized protein n=1 Tax=Amycolatopsis tolypomycina TaxID=208445 RepID=A0A1H4JHI2_9PSEU|nr:hypothetical protein [Amycolatopsis tolypomycina]SEB45617.1 hypothetical protein SAMN04489727_1897 [Amycolatopsis tolypomycina]
MSKHAATYAAQGQAKESQEPLSPEAVVRAYEESTSEHWRAFLKVMAHESLTAADGWVGWEKLCDGAGITRKVGSGVLGAAEKRLKGAVPFEKEKYSDSYRFRMPKQVAELIIKLAQEGPEESLGQAGNLS